VISAESTENRLIQGAAAGGQAVPLGILDSFWTQFFTLKPAPPSRFPWTSSSKYGTILSTGVGMAFSSIRRAFIPIPQVVEGEI
jgi:hypothetical protein